MKGKITIGFEIVALATFLTLGVLWISYPDNAFDGPALLAGLILAATDFYRRNEGHLFKTERHKFTPGELVQHREKMRQQFQEEIYRCRHEKLRKDVIIRHVNRVDDYPNIDDRKKGISPWFRVGLIDTYERGIVLGLHYSGLVATEDGYRGADYTKQEHGDTTLLLAATVPYEYIETVNMDGDKYYNYPHIYCYYWNKGQPYERLYYCEEVDVGSGHPYYREVVTFEKVKRSSDVARVKNFY